LSRWAEHSSAQRGDDYDERWRALAAAGQSVHGEADLLCTLRGSGSMLDAGCGTGRVAIEMARRGFSVAGVDLDEAMLSTARTKAPELEWQLGDLADVELQRRFDLVALPGNVMIFLAPGTEDLVVANLERHLAADGLLVAGFQLRRSRLSLDRYDQLCADVGLVVDQRWATWDQEPFNADGAEYVVSVHRRATLSG
jgi:SAM-dependent methyltransferase